MFKIIIAGLDGCLGSAFLGLSDLLSLSRRAITAASASSSDAGPTPPDAFAAITASATGRPIHDGAGVSFEVPGSGTCGALVDGGPNELRSASNDGVPGQYLFQVRGGSIDVPEPAGMALLGAGLMVLAGSRRRRRWRPFGPIAPSGRGRRAGRRPAG